MAENENIKNAQQWAAAEKKVTEQKAKQAEYDKFMLEYAEKRASLSARGITKKEAFETFKLLQKQQAEEEKIAKIVEERQQIAESVNTTYDDISTSISNMVKEEQILTKSGNDRFNLGQSVLKLGQENLKLLQNSVVNQNISNDIQEDVKTTIESINGEEQDLATIRQDQISFQNQLNNLGEDALDDDAESLKLILDLLKLKEKQLQTSNALAESEMKIAEMAGPLYDMYKGAADQVDRMGVGVGSMFIGLGLVGSALAGVFKILTSFSGKVDAIGAEFGAFGVQELAGPITAAEGEAIMMGKSLEDVISLTSQLGEDFGMSLEAAAGMSDEILNASTYLGLSVEEGGQLFGTLMTVSKLSLEQADNFVASTNALAKANKVSPVAVMKDMAQSSGLIASHSADSLGSIAEAAVQAKKMGLGLKDVESISNSLLDFQSSLNAEVEASLMIGKDLNFQKARQLALEGDLSGMMDDVLRQLGGEAEFNKLNILQRQSLAKSLGVEVDQLAKMVGHTGDLEPAPGFMDMLGPEALSSLTKLYQMFQSLGAEFVNVIGPELEIIVGHMVNFIKQNKLIEKARDFIKNFGKTFEETTKKVETFIGDLKKNFHSFLQQVGSVFTTLKRIAIGAVTGFAFGGPIGMLIGATVGYFVDNVASYFGGASKEFDDKGGEVSDKVKNSGKLNDFISRPGQGAQSFSAQDTIIGTKGKLVDFEPLMQEIQGLRRDMDDYFGGGRTAVKAIGAEVFTAIKRAE